MKTSRSLVLVSEGNGVSAEFQGTLFSALQEKLATHNLLEQVSLEDLIANGYHFPVVIIYPEAVIYSPKSEADLDVLVEEHFVNRQVARSLLIPPTEYPNHFSWLTVRKGVLPAEQRIVLRRSGEVDPTSIEDYIRLDGFQALAKVLEEMSPRDVIGEIEKSGLRGRGGAGFPTGLKMKFVFQDPKEGKYVVCNADESEPGTYKDRLILEGDPFSIIEAMIIAGYVVGAQEGYIYIRGEYRLAQERMKNAIEQSRTYGLLGENVLGTGLKFDIHIHTGAGAYICGEETALIESIEGLRGEPRSRPPYPTSSGLWGKPTLVNNVETLANLPPILLNGASWYRQFGTSSSPGTKVFTILGNINVPRLIEVPMGITLREVVLIYGKGMKGGAQFKLAQTGGSSGAIIPASLQDTPLDYDSFAKAGVSLGSGALLLCSDETCVVDLAKVLMNFFRTESCGKCSPCRVGNEKAHQILTRISEGRGTMKDIEHLELLRDNLSELSNCGLGQTAGTPLRDVLNYFRSEVEAHIRLKVCPSGVCPMTSILELPIEMSFQEA